MSLETQLLQKQISIFKQSLKFQEAAAGVVIQRVPSAYLYRILRPLIDARAAAPNEREANRIRAMDHCPDRRDPLVHAIYNMDETFRGCATKGVDMLSSAEGIASEHTFDGTSGNGCLFLAWKTTYDTGEKRLRDPELVGAMTVYKFKRTSNFSTDAASTGRDDAKLAPYFQSGKYLYIDSMCAVGGGGVGRILVLHAYRYAMTKKSKGLVALSYSRNKLTGSAKPESYKIFDDFGFKHLIENANYTIQMYGTWFAIDLDAISFAGVTRAAIDICTRRGFTEKTKNTLVWRCPQ